MPSKAHFKSLGELLQKSMKAESGTHIYLLRHGQSMGNHTGSVVGWTDTKLSVKGREQANSMFQALYPFVDKFSSIHSSDLSRCRDTLKLSLGFTNRKVQPTEQLRELNFGDHEGLHYDSLPNDEKAVISSLKYRAPNGQTWPEARKRAIDYLSQFNEGHHLVGTHGGLICALTYELGIKSVVPNCSMVAVELCPTLRDLKALKFQWLFEE